MQLPLSKHSLQEGVYTAPLCLNSSFVQGNFKIVAGKPEHLQSILLNLRKADFLEISNLEQWNKGSRLVAEVIKNSSELSSVFLALLQNDKCIAVGGVAPSQGFGGGWHCPWLVGTEDLTGNAGAFRAVARFFKLYLAKNYPKLMNVTFTSANSKTLIWLRSLGFKITPLQNEAISTKIYFESEQSAWLFARELATFM